MPNATPAAFDAPIELDESELIERDLARTGAPAAAIGLRSDVRLAVHTDLATIADQWRAFEQVSDCTAFQSFGWLSTWQRHIGVLQGTLPALVTGHDRNGDMLFLLPLAVEPFGPLRRLVWLGSNLCDYNAPLLGSEFPLSIDAPRFRQLWREILERLQAHPLLAFDLIDFEKMAEKVGGQRNPFLDLSTAPHPNRAFMAELGSDWDKFYAAKRSSATRRRDRTKRNRMAEFGAISFVTPDEATGIAATLDTLIEQKSRQFAKRGVPNAFVRPGHRVFFHAVATNTETRSLVHVSRLDMGSTVAAANMGLVFRGCYYHLLASYNDGEISRFGPGAAHRHDLLRYAIGRGCRVFDFTIGDESYKHDWCETEMVLYDHISAVSARGRLAALPLMALRGVKRWVKTNPALWKLAEAVRARLGALRQRRTAA